MRKRKNKGRNIQRERRIFHGDWLDVHIFPVFQKPGKRRKKTKPTSEVQEKLNQKYRENKVEYQICSNFDKNDWTLRLSFDDEHLPETYSGVQRVVGNFTRALRRFRVKYDLPELKYMYTIERGARKGRFHIHMITSGEPKPILIGYDEKEKEIYVDYRRFLEELWKKYGGCIGRSFPLEFNDEGSEELAKYLVKEPETENAVIDEKIRRWASSKNLKKPVIPEDRDNFISKKTTKDIREGNICEREIERLYKGYTVISIEPFFNNVNAGEYLTIRLRRTKVSRERKEIFKQCRKRE